MASEQRATHTVVSSQMCRLPKNDNWQLFLESGMAPEKVATWKLAPYTLFWAKALEIILITFQKPDFFLEN